MSHDVPKTKHKTSTCCYKCSYDHFYCNRTPSGCNFILLMPQWWWECSTEPLLITEANCGTQGEGDMPGHVSSTWTTWHTHTHTHTPVSEPQSNTLSVTLTLQMINGLFLFKPFGFKWVWSTTSEKTMSSGALNHRKILFHYVQFTFLWLTSCFKTL